MIQLRVPVPRPLQAKFGKPLLTKTMNTSDPREADRRAEPYRAAWNAEFERLRADNDALPDLPTLAVTRTYAPTLAKLEASRRTVPDDDAACSEHLEKRAAELRKLTRWRADGRHDAWEAVADRMIEKNKLPIEKGSEEYTKLVETIADSLIDAYSVFNRRSAGDLEAEPRTETVRQVLDRTAKPAEAGETVMELFERYGAQRIAEKRKRLDGVNQDRKKLQLFMEFVGEGRSAASIEQRDVLNFRFAIEALPGKFKGQREYRGLSIAQAVEKARSLNVPTLAKTTVNSYIAALSGFFDWLHELGYVGRNPCDGVAYRLLKGQNPRPTFSTEQLNEILTSPLFTGFQADGKEHLKGNVRADDWRYWIPLVCLFSGARLGEIAQLRTDDVRKERGLWFMHLRHDEATGQTTKSGMSRAAPIHSKLIELGFLDFHERQVKRAGEDGNQAMFPELEKNARGQISGKVGRWWRDYLEAIGLKNGGDGYGSHSFRHTMADLLRDEAELLDNDIAVALGHNQKTTTSGYGRLKQGTVTRLQSYFEAVRFEGVDFSHLKREAVMASL
jgi:integrase